MLMCMPYYTCVIDGSQQPEWSCTTWKKHAATGCLENKLASQQKGQNK